MRRFVAAGVALAALAVIPTFARANHCSSAIVVFSRSQAQRDAGLAAVNPGAVFCAEGGTETGVDTRLLVPGAVEISIRYTRDLGATVPTLTAIVNGLGFAETPVTMTRFTDSATGLRSYASPFVAIPAGGGASGAVRVRIDHVKIAGGSDAVCFRTWDAGC